MRLRRRFCVVLLVATVAVLGRPKRAEALVFKDVAAFLQRNSHYLIQFRQLLSAAKDTRRTLLDAYTGLKDWRNLGWTNTLDLVHAPWFDDIDGIEDLRAVSDLTVLSVEQATKLIGDIQNFDDLRQHPRYRRDGWFRARVDSIRGISARARSRRVALLRQMQLHNRALTNDISRIKRIRDRIEEENKKTPVNQGLIMSLQGELAAVQAKYEGENMILVNQRAIMGLVGRENMDESFREATDGDWVGRNREGFRNFGRSFTK
jgi:hypothetical protein